MKAFLVSYDFRELQKSKATNILKEVCKRLPKMACDPKTIS
jgi:hypothetical protein